MTTGAWLARGARATPRKKRVTPVVMEAPAVAWAAMKVRGQLKTHEWQGARWTRLANQVVPVHRRCLCGGEGEVGAT